MVECRVTAQMRQANEHSRIDSAATAPRSPTNSLARGHCTEDTTWLEAVPRAACNCAGTTQMPVLRSNGNLAIRVARYSMNRSRTEDWVRPPGNLVVDPGVDLSLVASAYPGQTTNETWS